MVQIDADVTLATNSTHTIHSSANAIHATRVLCDLNMNQFFPFADAYPNVPVDASMAFAPVQDSACVMLDS